MQMPDDRLYYTFPGFSGLLYAALNGNTKIALELLDEECDLFTSQELLIPTCTGTKIFNHQSTYLEYMRMYKARGIENISVLPRSSTVLDLCLLAGNIRMYAELAQHIERRYVSHVNDHGRNNFHYLIELQGHYELRPVDQRNRDFYYFMFQRYCLLYSPACDNFVVRSVAFGNFMALDVVFRLLSSRYKHVFDTFIRLCRTYYYYVRPIAQDNGAPEESGNPLGLSDNQLACMEVIRRYQDGYYDYFNYVERGEDEGAVRVQEVDENAKEEYTLEARDGGAYSRESDTYNDVSAVLEGQKIVRLVRHDFNPMEYVSMSPYEKRTYRYKFSQLYKDIDCERLCIPPRPSASPADLNASGIRTPVLGRGSHANDSVPASPKADDI